MKRMRYLAVSAAALVLVMSFSAMTRAQQDPTKPETKTITAEVIDTACYMNRGATGPDHASCAKMCGENGVPLALLDKANDTIYYPLDGMNDPNKKLIGYAGKMVKVTGKVTMKSHNYSITLEKVEEVKGL